MVVTDPYEPFLNLADDLTTNRISERDLSVAILQLPFVDEELLILSGQRAEEIALREPRRSWALTNVVHRATQSQRQDPFLQSLAGWYLGRAFNHWGQPKRVKTVISRVRGEFAKLNLPGWVAACDWQLYVLSWARPDTPRSVEVLAQALVKLQRAEFTDFAAHCGLALAYAQLLIGRYEDAWGNIQASEARFDNTGDRLNLARCWLVEASTLRRQDRIQEALKKLEESLEVFERQSALVDAAKTHYQLGLCHLRLADDLTEASSQFEKATDFFEMQEMDLWQATVTTNLGYIHLLTGSLEKANKLFAKARTVFTRHKVLGALADNLNDSGKLNTLRGYPAVSIEQFKQAEALHEKLGLKLPVAIDAANLGEAYGFVGRYQDALYQLERAAEHFRTMNNPLRLGACEKSTALVWTQLGRLDFAVEHLEQASASYELSGQKALLSSIYNDRASILFRQNDNKGAVDYLKKSLDIATRHGVKPQSALAKRLLGEGLSRTGQDAEALYYLNEAFDEFTSMGMVMDQAFTLVALGMHYSQLSEIDKAKVAFEHALRLSLVSMPEIEWRAYAGLAELHGPEDDAQAKILLYRHAMLALSKIRQNFWQPSLAGSYLGTAAPVFASALQFAVEQNANEEALQLLELQKATTLREQLQTPVAPSKNRKLRELVGLRSEVIWLQNQSKATLESTNLVKSALELRQIRSQIIEKTKLYDRELARLERRKYSGERSTSAWSAFDLTKFCNLAGNALGKNWAALDFHMTDNRLITLVITPENSHIEVLPITNRINMALEMIDLKRQQFGLSQSDLRVLGDFLIPSSLASSLEPNTFLLLAPHQKLHRIPWAAIKPSAISKPLVNHCIPVVVPSLDSLCLLWQRLEWKSQPSKRDNGLAVGLSTFAESHDELPHVKEEIAALAAKLGSQGKVLLESDATWSNLNHYLTKERSNRKYLQHTDFDWLHVASHFFIDSHTGRTSGIVLWDGDVWLDQLRDLAPLPKLVTFSGCNSIFSFVYEGDEHMDIPSTCFISGANTVVGSTRRILDESAAEFTASFYEHYLSGLSPAHAVAQTQRQMAAQAKSVDNWASFVCMGVP